MHPAVSQPNHNQQINITANPGSEGGGLVPYQPGPHNSHHPPPVYYPQSPAHMADGGMAAPSPPPPGPAAATASTAAMTGKPQTGHQAQIVTEDPVLDASGAVIGGKFTLISTKYFYAMH